MASAAEKFQAPNPTTSVDQGKFKKLAQRVEETLSTETLYPEPKQLDPNVVLVSPLNRLGGFTKCAPRALWDPEVLPEELLRPQQAGHWDLCGVPVGAGDQEAHGAQPAVLTGQQAPATDHRRNQCALVWILGMHSSEPGFQGHQEWDSLSHWSS